MIAAFALLAACAPPVCNGSADLCERRIDEVAFAGTHNAMSNADEGWIAPNQTHAPLQQLAEGIRVLVFDLHPLDDGTPGLCHGYCSLGSKPLVDGLSELRTFLDANPDEVVVVIFESYLPEREVDASFVASGLSAYAYAGSSDPWPTLGTLIDVNQRLIVFTDDASTTLPWHRYSYTSLWENPYHAEAAEELATQCGLDRGDRALPLWTLNHFLTAPLASAELAASVNFDPFFEDRVRACMAETGDFPNFVLVDFYDVGDVLAVVSSLNTESP